VWYLATKIKCSSQNQNNRLQRFVCLKTGPIAKIIFSVEFQSAYESKFATFDSKYEILFVRHRMLVP
jgi:hypothetical protein